MISGALLGIWAGYAKGATDEIIMRLADVVMAFPQTILVLLFVSIIGAKLWLLTLMVGAIHAPQVARVARAATLRIAGEDFILYAESVGTARWRIIVREIFPNITSPLMVEFGLRLAYSVTLIAGLSFLGFGAQPPAADWGLMINENRIGLMTCPWPVLVPILLIALLTIGMNLLTDAAARAMLGGARRHTAADTPVGGIPDLAERPLATVEAAVSHDAPGGVAMRPRSGGARGQRSRDRLSRQRTAGRRRRLVHVAVWRDPGAGRRIRVRARPRSASACSRMRGAGWRSTGGRVLIGGHDLLRVRAARSAGMSAGR